MTQITQGASIVQFGYDTANRRTSLTLPNNIRVEYGYDAASSLTSITYKQNGTTVLGDLTYEYDKAGNRTKTGGSWARTGMPEPVTTSYDAGNRQLTFGDKSLAYDDNGNLQSITDSNGTTLYQWNARNQLVGISGPSVNASFVYDGMGRREAKTINGSLTEFLYDGLNPVQETSGATVLSNILAGVGVDEFLTRTEITTGVSSNFLSDVLGSPIALIDNIGVVQTEFTYEAFGRDVASGAPSSNSYRFTGRENDGTGLHYYRKRYYNAELSRFIKEDSINVALPGENLYVYAYNSPTFFTDPLGLEGLALGIQGQLILDGLLKNAYQFGIGFYISDKECGFYFSKALSGSGFMAGIGLNAAGFSGANPFGTANNFQAQAGFGLGFSYDDNYNIDGPSAGIIGPGVGAAWTRDRTTPLLRFRFACPRCSS